MTTKKRKFIFICLIFVLLFPLISSTTDYHCRFYDISQPIASILCAVEKEIWTIPTDTIKFKNMDCLIGKGRCNEVMKVPKESEVPASPPPPNAKNPQYQELALKAEAVVPKTWWRAGFADDKLLLSKSNDDLPKKLFDIGTISNKKLKNIYQCVTRQHFMRKSYDFENNPHQDSTEVTCTAMDNHVVKDFFQLWQQYKGTLDGSFTPSQDKSFQIWTPNLSENGKFVMKATEVLEHFFTNYGGIWTGCFAYEKFPECRGALAAAALVTATQLIYDIAGKQKPFTDTQFTKGYILASLGRGLYHGDFGTTGIEPRTSWKLQLNDFIALQSAYLKLYIDSYGQKYNEQLDHFIPFTFSGDFPIHAKSLWKSYSTKLEPVYTSLRNWMFTECSNLIDFGPYRPLVAFNEVHEKLLPISSESISLKSSENKMKSSTNPKQRRILIDIGANGFFASPKFLIDSYAVYLPFTDVIMVEPEPHFSATIPPVYSKRYNISFLPIYAEVATGSKTDMIQLLPTLVTPEDFVVLKFDVDPNKYAYGPTMEWGFLFEIMQRPEVAKLIDEVYIELHFHFPSLYWKHYHSNWEGLDTFRYLRSHGVVVHSWP